MPPPSSSARATEKPSSPRTFRRCWSTPGDVAFLEDGEIAEVRADGFRILDSDARTLKRSTKRITWDALAAQKDGYRHFMLKEIHEQPQAVTDTLRGRISLDSGAIHLPELNLTEDQLAHTRKIHLVGCGTAWHAALVGKFLIEELARIPVEVDYGSEFRHRTPLLGPDSLLLLVSQSGETADTLAALEVGRRQGAGILSICNVVDSSLARKSDGVFYTHAGPEISVASTKAFTTQLTALYLLAVKLGRLNGQLLPDAATRLLEDATRLPGWIEAALKIEEAIAELAHGLSRAGDILYLGRGINYPIALEGALKLKEISYIHAEGYPAGEMKHGPIALIDESMPVVMLLPRDHYFRKTLGNLKEVEARGGNVVIVTDEPDESMAPKSTLVVPKVPYHLAPVVLTIPLQLLAYHVAVHRGTDVDQPRNLAKSVTVE